MDKLHEYKVWKTMQNSISIEFFCWALKNELPFITMSFINSLRAGTILCIFIPLPVWPLAVQ